MKASPSPCNGVLLEKPTLTRIINNSLPFTAHYNSLPYSQELTTGLYPEPDETSPNPCTIYLYNPFSYYASIYAKVFTMIYFLQIF
jgi:hypothetical protein